MYDDSAAAAQERMSRLLADWANQDPAARERIVPIVYNELRRLAHHYMRGERPGHTLQTTALVNEVYLRLAGIKTLQWRDRAHFFAMAGTLMRRILVDYARQRGRDKRGGGETVPNWGRVKRVLEGALEHDGDARQTYLAAACGGDAALRAQVDDLLASHASAAAFLATPAGMLLDRPRPREDLSGRVVNSYR